MDSVGVGPWEQDEHAKILCDDWKNLEFFNLNHYLKYFQKQICSNYELDHLSNENFLFDLVQQDGSICSSSSKTKHGEKKVSHSNGHHHKSNHHHQKNESKPAARKSLPSLNNLTNESNKNQKLNNNYSTIQVLKPTEIKTDHFHTFEHIENSINTQIMKLKVEKKTYSHNSTTLEHLKPVMTHKNSNNNLYYENHSGSSSTTTTTTTTSSDVNKSRNGSPSPPNVAPITISNQTIKLDDLNIYYDYRLSSSENPFLSSANPSTVYRLQKILNIPKENKPTTTKYRLPKNMPAKTETFYKPASSYTDNATCLPPTSASLMSQPAQINIQSDTAPSRPIINHKLLRSLTNSTSSEENDDIMDDTETQVADQKIVEIEKIRNKLKEEYNNLLLNSTNIAARPKSATICCTPNIQYLKSTINKHTDLETNIQEELRIVPINKILVSRPSSAATCKTKLTSNTTRNNSNNNRFRRPHYIDCESDDLAYELDRSLCQFKYDSSSSNLMINSTQIPISRGNRDSSKQSFYSTYNPTTNTNEEKKVYVTSPVKNLLNHSNSNKIQLESLMNYSVNKPTQQQICINGKSMSAISGVEFTSNIDNQSNRVNLERKSSKKGVNSESEIKKIQIKFNQLTKIGVK